MKVTAWSAPIVVLALAGCGGSSGAARWSTTSAATAATVPMDVKLGAPSTPIGVGQAVDVTLSASAVSGLYGAGVDLAYDPALLELQGVSDGGLVPDADVGAGGAPGSVTVALAARGDSAGGTGSGAIVVVHFIARSAGTAEVRPSGVVLQDAAGREGLSAAMSPVQLTIR